MSNSMGMPGPHGGAPRVELTVDEAAALLRLPVEAVEALLRSGYLQSATASTAEPRLALGDLKAFLARNPSEAGSSEQVDATSPLDELGALEEIDPQSLIDALDGRTDDMARRALDVMRAAFPEAATWTLTHQARFVEHARSRFEAILAVAGSPGVGDDALAAELVEVGEQAGESGTSLAEVLLVLRISRDLIVQTGVEVAEERGRRWGLALSLLLTRILPVLDRLTDAIARGWWAAALERQQESQARFANIVERASDGVYEIDLDGRLRYANRSLALILGLPLAQLEGASLVDVVVPADPDVPVTLDADQIELAVRRADGVIRVLDIRTVERRAGDVVVGYDGIVRDLTATRQLEELKNDFLGLITHEVRQPLSRILGLGITLESYAEDLGPARVQSIGETLREQAERIARLADDLADFSGLEYDSLLLSRRPVDVAAAVGAALAAVQGSGDVEVRVASGVGVIADRRRLEQVIANLVENAVTHGGPPVVVEAEPVGTEVEMVVRDHGPGVDASIEAALFSRLWPLTGRPHRAGSGLGLALVRGLVEAMGGRVWYVSGDDGGACFLLRLPAA